jgi:hypothetical protein
MRTITATTSDGRYLPNVASLINNNFTMDLFGVVYNNHSATKPERDTFCFGLFVYDPDGKGCQLCPTDMCPEHGMPPVRGRTRSPPPTHVCTGP